MPRIFKKTFKNPNLYVMVAADALMVAAALIFAFLLRYDGHLSGKTPRLFTMMVPVYVAVKLVVFYFFGLYRGMWRYTGLRDFKNIVGAVALSSLVLAAYLMFLYRFEGFSRSVIAIDFVLTFILVGGIRLGVRMVLNRDSGGVFQGFAGRNRDAGFRRIMVIGAGNAGEKAVRDMLDNRSMKMRPVGFLDDDRGKWGKSIHGVRVLGGADSIMKHLDLFDETVIAMPSATGEQIRRVVSLCYETGKRYLIMPGLGEMLNGGGVSVKAVRKVRYEDLLGRDVIRLDAELIRKTYRGKRIMVTGAGGSIGRELVRQVAAQHPGALGLLDSSEYNLFRVEMNIRQQFEFIPVSSYLVNIRDEKSLARALMDYKPEVIFHAAALKHVPMQEMNPWEAVLTNVQGTRNLISAARGIAPERFVLVSTDKAVRPSSVMGATKRVAEMLVECAGDGTSSRFVSVRFGNVLGSSGSVIPLFMEQIKSRLPITVTHPDITRYFMSVSEAGQLILQAGAMGEGGELFILDMGKPVRIADMARDLVRLNGFEPGKDVSIRFIGLRPGEKLHEELITEGEGIVCTRHDKIRVIRGRHCNYTAVNGYIDELINTAKTYDIKLIKQKLKEIVPEYVPGGAGHNRA
ncbi:MAG TPA: polysaccharide biosynthesis protein [Desulfobacteraceae bacterium]|nr:polysaccharide biosynthesis protein [Desulfobacteraceae bacterium]